VYGHVNSAAEQFDFYLPREEPLVSDLRERRVQHLVSFGLDGLDIDIQIGLGFVESIAEATGIDISVARNTDELRAEIVAKGLEIRTEDASWEQMADDLLSKFVEPTLVLPTFVMDYPVELSPFARAHRTRPGLVERWEAFAGGMEIANAFSELTDPDVQRERFEAQQRLATLGEEEVQPYDELFVQALEQGMPPAGGVGLGVDRLVMLLTGRDSIREVVLFPAMRD